MRSTSCRTSRTNANAIENTISQLQSGTAGSKLYDAMEVGVEMLSDRPGDAAEDGSAARDAGDVGSEGFGSTAKLGEVLRKAQLANVTIYAVGISGAKAE